MYPNIILYPLIIPKILPRIYLPLRGYDKHGRFVLLMRNGNSDPKTMQMEEMFKVRMLGPVLVY